METNIFGKILEDTIDLLGYSKPFIPHKYCNEIEGDGEIDNTVFYQSEVENFLDEYSVGRG